MRAELNAGAHLAESPPSAWVTRFAPLIPVGEVLDLACGSGRHARMLAVRGLQVLAVDRHQPALETAAGEGITTRQIDLEDGSAWPFSTAQFTAIVVTNYLHRPLFPAICRSLATGGLLIYETFALGNEQFGKPSNPDFLLGRGELLRVAREGGLEVIAYEDLTVDTPKPAVVQRICARRM
jgi:SAM-dependent methyltransferase